MSDAKQPDKSKVDPTLAGAAKARGKRPWFFEDRDVERVMNIAMTLAMELSVTRQRLDALERVLSDKGVLDCDEIEGFKPDPEAEAERQQWQHDFIARVLRILIQSREAEQSEQASVDQAMEAVMRELSES